MVELYHFAGLTLDEIAAVQGCSAPTVHRRLKSAQAWLAHRLRDQRRIMQITPERWRRIRTIFEAVVERPTEERERFLDDACSGDPELLRQVGSLIVASEGAGEAMADAIADAAADTAATMRVGVPERVGHYRILDTLGEGGMGLVLLAERDDESYRQEVAVKVIKQTLTSEDVVRRFENERQILADLDHPAIARLLDGGTTEVGDPFLVMEHVEGRPINVYCREEGLDTEQRVQLFVEVCDAVSHAHHRLVVHRDLKPSNILVTADGSPKLLDFGIAKLLDPERAGAGLTRTGMAALTPEYASPEQVLGEPITTASDVYSLGVLLYELVVGRSPYGESVYTPAALVRAICEGRPERPSDVRRRDTFGDSDTSGALATPRGLRKELDWILLTALRKEPERRYASVDELAKDLRRLPERAPRPRSPGLVALPDEQVAAAALEAGYGRGPRRCGPRRRVGSADLRGEARREGGGRGEASRGGIGGDDGVPGESVLLRQPVRL